MRIATERVDLVEELRLHQRGFEHAVTTVQIAENASIEQEGKGTTSDLLPGLGVGVTGKPDGSNVTAVSIRIFPAALGTPRPGQFPMTGANQGNLMTNSTIESFDGSQLVLNSAGQRYQIAVPPGTQPTHARKTRSSRSDDLPSASRNPDTVKSGIAAMPVDVVNSW